MSINYITHSNPYYYYRPIQPYYACTSCQLPNSQRNYCTFDKNEVDYFVKQKEHSLPVLTDILQHSENEAQITEALYILDRMIDNGTKGIDKMYPVLSKFNHTDSPNIQTFLAGIYRKTQVPDAFGTLINMLIKNSQKPHNPQEPFDPNEEIGGAILSYLSDRFRE
jgi:hypothetical protein